MRPKMRLYSPARILKYLFCISCAWLLASCSTVPRINTNGYANVASTEDNTHQVRRTNFPICAQHRVSDDIVEECDRRLFVGVAISGGGSRAANFSLGALWQLNQLGLFRDVTAISSVSGGSLTAAYVSLFGLESPAEFERAARDLQQDFLSHWLWHSLYPSQALKVALTHATSTETLADTFNDMLFHGKTFADLGKFGLYHPYLYINAALQNSVPSSSHLTTRGENSPSLDLQGFTFTSEAFNALQSNLAAYRIADAVAASGAYPGMFEPLVLKNHDPFPPNWQQPTTYLHLSDGGTADNLGIDALIRAAQEFNANSLDLVPTHHACLLILIDAAVHDPAIQYGAMPDLRTNPVKTLVSSSLFTAFDVLLERRRDDQLSALGINEASDNGRRFQPAVEIPLGNYSYWDAGTSKSRGRGINLSPAVGIGEHKTTMTCAVWHISFEHLQDVTTGRTVFQRENFGPFIPVDEKPVPGRENEISRLDYFVNSIDTSYKLVMTGKSTCSPGIIQHALFDASRVLVRDDTPSLIQLVNWLRENGRPRLADTVLDNFMFETPVDKAPNYQTHGSRDSLSPKWISCQSQ
jgi:NTE family protein